MQNDSLTILEMVLKLFGMAVALLAALFGGLRWLYDRDMKAINKRFEGQDKRFDELERRMPERRQRDTAVAIERRKEK